MDYLKENRRKISLLLSKRHKNNSILSQNPAKGDLRETRKPNCNQSDVQQMKKQHNLLQTSTNFTKLLMELKSQLKNELTQKKRKNPTRNDSQSCQPQIPNNINQSASVNKKLKVIQDWLHNEGPTIDVNLLEYQLEITRKASQNLLLETNKKWRCNILKRNNFNQAIFNQDQRTIKRLTLRLQKSHNRYHSGQDRNNKPKRQKTTSEISISEDRIHEDRKRTEIRRHSCRISQFLSNSNRIETITELSQSKEEPLNYLVLAQKRDVKKFNNDNPQSKSLQKSKRKTYSIELLKGRNICTRKKDRNADLKKTKKQDSAWAFDPW